MHNTMNTTPQIGPHAANAGPVNIAQPSKQVAIPVNPHPAPYV